MTAPFAPLIPISLSAVVALAACGARPVSSDVAVSRAELEAGTARTTAAPIVPNAPEPWCDGLSINDDSSTDMTGVANDQARVGAVGMKLRGRVLNCPGVTGFGSGLDRIEHALQQGEPFEAQALPGDDRSFVIRVLVRSKGFVPKTNPLYVEGVRVYFVVRDYRP